MVFSRRPAFVVAWQFRAELRGGYDEARERKALRLIAIRFFVLAIYVVIEAARDLFFIDAQADVSTVGIVLSPPSHSSSCPFSHETADGNTTPITDPASRRG